MFFEGYSLIPGALSFDTVDKNEENKYVRNMQLKVKKLRLTYHSELSLLLTSLTTGNNSHRPGIELMVSSPGIIFAMWYDIGSGGEGGRSLVCQLING